MSYPGDETNAPPPSGADDTASRASDPDAPAPPVADETPLMLQVATDDRFSFRMGVEPGLAVAKQLVRFVITHPIVLLVIEYRH